MISLSLAEISAAVEGVLVVGNPAVTVSGAVETDSRLVVAGSVFFALVGESTDGRLFAGDASRNGAALIVTSDRLELEVPQIIVADPLAALATLARLVVSRVRARGMLRVIGITGSNGKTTTKNMLRAILAAEGQTVAPQGSYNNHVGAPYTMLLIDYETKFLVIEMGASAIGDIAKTIAIVVPDISVVLTVGMAHVGEFGGIDATQRAKSEIVTKLPAAAVAVLNRDDYRVASMAAQTAARPLWFGLDDTADIRAEDLRATALGTSFILRAGAQTRNVTLRVLGEHNVMNALAAIAVAGELGIGLDAALDSLGTVDRAERWRMEVLHPSAGITVINDAYNASPDSTAAALKALAQILEPGQRSVAVLGEMNALGEHAQEEHDRIGRLVVRLNIQKLVVVGHRARHIHNAAGLEGSWDGESVLVQTNDEAYDLLRDELRPGDVVLVKSSNAAELRFLGDRIGGLQQ